MSKKKVLALILCTLLSSSTILSVSANQTYAANIPNLPGDTKNAVHTPVVQSNYKTMLPGDEDINNVSASYLHYKINASRTNNGDVEVYINETYANNRAYVEHLATDVTGDTFTPEKNSAYYLNDQGLHRIILPANSVSADGYVYLTVSLAPWISDSTMNPIRYKIPVDYQKNKVSESSMVNIQNRSEMSLSCSVAIFKSRAERMSNGDVIVYVDTEHMDAYALWFEHLATSRDNTIYMPQKNSWYKVVPYPANNYTSQFILPANTVAADGNIYFDIYMDIPIGRTHVIRAKLPVNY